MVEKSNGLDKVHMEECAILRELARSLRQSADLLERLVIMKDPQQSIPPSQGKQQPS